MTRRSRGGRIVSPNDAIARARHAHQVVGARWPALLLECLLERDGRDGAYDWLCGRVDGLLLQLDRSTDELREAIALARRSNDEGADLDVIDQRAWALWRHREGNGGPRTAVAQLLFARTRAEQNDNDPRLFSLALATPICVLERGEPRPGAIFERVIEMFSAHVGLDPRRADHKPTSGP